jgi:hypothetical protein
MTRRVGPLPAPPLLPMTPLLASSPSCDHPAGLPLAAVLIKRIRPESIYGLFMPKVKFSFFIDKRRHKL